MQPAWLAAPQPCAASLGWLHMAAVQPASAGCSSPARPAAGHAACKKKEKERKERKKERKEGKKKSEEKKLKEWE